MSSRPHKSATELVRRYIVFFTALVVGAFGVTLVTRSTLGVNSVACFSYVTSVYFPVTMGTIVIAFNSLMLVSQLFIFTKEQRKTELVNLILQVPAIFVFGLMVDVWMYVTQDFHPDAYWIKMAALLIGSAIIALNIALQATASVTMLACDAFVRYLALRINKKLGNVKLVYDLLLVASAAAMSLICSDFTEIVGIREGTVIGAVIIGPMVQIILQRLGFLKNWCEYDLRHGKVAPAVQK